jgi:hypothetical protein
VGGSEEGGMKRNINWKKIGTYAVCLAIILNTIYAIFIEDTFGSPWNLIPYEDMVNIYGVSVNLTGEASQKESQQVFTILKKLSEKYNPKKSSGIFSDAKNLENIKIESHEQGIVYVTLNNQDTPSSKIFESHKTYELEHKWTGRWKIIDVTYLP